jgi:hypothetical protein
VATITISMIYTNWGKSLVKSMTESTTNKSETLGDCIYAQIDINDLKIDRTSNLIEAVVGSSAFSDTSVTLKSIIAYNDTGSYCVLNSSNYNLNKGDITIVKNISCSIFSKDCANFKMLKVTTDCASSAEFSTNDTDKILCIN